MNPADILKQYDAIEVAACIDLGDGEIERISGHPNPDLFTVYLHDKEGGVQALADCANEEYAMVVANALQQYLSGIPVHVFK